MVVEKGASHGETDVCQCCLTNQCIWCGTILREQVAKGHMQRSYGEGFCPGRNKCPCELKVPNELKCPFCEVIFQSVQSIYEHLN